MHAKSLHLCPTLCPLKTVAHQAPLTGDYLGKNTEVGGRALLQGIFSTQGSIPSLFTSLALADRFFTASTT